MISLNIDGFQMEDKNLFIKGELAKLQSPIGLTGIGKTLIKARYCGDIELKVQIGIDKKGNHLFRERIIHQILYAPEIPRNILSERALNIGVPYIMLEDDENSIRFVFKDLRLILV